MGKAVAVKTYMPSLSCSSSDGKQSKEPVVVLAFMQSSIRVKACYCRMGVVGVQLKGRQHSRLVIEE